MVFFVVNIILAFLNIICAIISACALCHVLPSAGELSFDYIGVIVGILALLTAVLIAWQIFSVINIRDIQKEITNHKRKVEDTTATNVRQSIISHMLLSISLAEYYLFRTDSKDEEKVEECYYNYIYQILSAIINATGIDEYNSADKYAVELIANIRGKAIPIDKDKKEELVARFETHI